MNGAELGSVKLSVEPSSSNNKKPAQNTFPDIQLKSPQQAMRIEDTGETRKELTNSEEHSGDKDDDDLDDFFASL